MSLVAGHPTPIDGKGPYSPLPGSNARASKIIAEGREMPVIVAVTDTTPTDPVFKRGVPEGIEVPVIVVEVPEP